MAFTISGRGIPTGGILDGAITSAKINSSGLAANSIASDAVTSAKIINDAVTSAKLADDLSLPGDTTVTQVTETVTTKSASFTPNLSTEGTVFSCSGTMTITMPSAEAGKSFTVIHSSGSSITWSGTILWNGGSAPDSAAAKEVYVFLSDGTSWYGNQAGTGYA